MTRYRLASLSLLAAATASLGVSGASGQARIVASNIVASGLNQPVQVTHAGDGSGRLFIVEQAGVIRIVESGTLSPTPFLDLRSIVGSGGERGLLGLAFHPDYEQNGFFYVNYTDLAGDTVIARYSVSVDPGIADPASAFTILNVEQPFANHNGGQIEFGPLDGYLYIGLGDGGSANDPLDHGQNRDTLLGSLLRIDVDGGSPYDVPPDNPFVGVDGADEIWAFGLRNPWRFSFDRVTGDLFIGDVGQGTWEEIDFQAAGTPGGGNFGWRVREGPCPLGASLPCAPAPAGFTDPIAFYDHSVGASVTGGFVYRGSQFPALAGRYFFGDFISGRIWSIARTGPATWSSAELELDAGFNISSFGEDENGELYVVDYSGGTIRRIESPSLPLLFVGSPTDGDATLQPFDVKGWAVDTAAPTGTGISEVHVWAFPEGGSQTFLGAATYGISKPGVAELLGDPRFEPSGFLLSVDGLLDGDYTIGVYARSTVTGQFDAVQLLEVHIGLDPHMSVGKPASGATVTVPFKVKGWAVERAAPSGTGVDAVHVWAYPAGNGAPVFLGEATYGLSRPGVASLFSDSELELSGFTLTVETYLPAGDYTLRVLARSTVTGLFDNSRDVPITIEGTNYLTVGKPWNGGYVAVPFEVSGWALNTGAASGVGVDAVRVWDISTNTFLGKATLGLSRPGVAATFGDQFEPSGYSLTVNTALAAGFHTLRVLARNSMTGVFEIFQDVQVNVVVGSSPMTAVEKPISDSLVSNPFNVKGWAVDLGASSGTGVDAVHVWAFPLGGGAATFLGAATMGLDRPDVAALLGNPNFQPSGFKLQGVSLASGSYSIVVYARSTVSGSFNPSTAMSVTVN